MGSATKLETITNITTTAVGLLLALVLIKVYILPSAVQRLARAPLSPSPQIGAGTNLSNMLPGVDFRQNGRTLVLAISTACHFCKESEPFYRRLRDEVGKGLKLVAVLPQPATEAEQYLKEQGIRVDQVQHVSLDDVGVRGTPTMLLVNEKGTVTRVWVGKIRDEEQAEVLSVLKKG